MMIRSDGITQIRTSPAGPCVLQRTHPPRRLDRIAPQVGP
jgi:hypothetical protein